MEGESRVIEVGESDPRDPDKVNDGYGVGFTGRAVATAGVSEAARTGCPLSDLWVG